MGDEIKEKFEEWMHKEYPQFYLRYGILLLIFIIAFVVGVVLLFLAQPIGWRIMLMTILSFVISNVVSRLMIMDYFKEFMKNRNNN